MGPLSALLLCDNKFMKTCSKRGKKYDWVVSISLNWESEVLRLQWATFHYLNAGKYNLTRKKLNNIFEWKLYNGREL